VIGVGWGLSPHASSFELKFTVSETSNSTEFSSKCLLEICWKSDLLICWTPLYYASYRWNSFSFVFLFGFTVLSFRLVYCYRPSQLHTSVWEHTVYLLTVLYCAVCARSFKMYWVALSVTGFCEGRFGRNGITTT